MSPEIGVIVIVARNNMHLTQKAVKSALEQDMLCDVLLVDNASEDGTLQWSITKPVARICWYEQKSLSACWNIALRAIWYGHTHAMVCNNDIEMRPDTYRHLLAHGGPFVTGVSVDSADQLRYPEPPTTERPHPDFSCFLIRKEVTDAIGWFDEEYFPAYAEDLDYHLRMHRAGIKAVSIDLPFVHHRSSTLKHADPAAKITIERGSEKNRERFREKYGAYPGTKEYEALFTSAPSL